MEVMRPMTTLHVRVDNHIKAQATEVFERMGLTMAEGVRAFLRRVAADQALPFAFQMPNAATQAAMEEARAMSVRFEADEEPRDDLVRSRR